MMIRQLLTHLQWPWGRTMQWVVGQSLVDKSAGTSRRCWQRLAPPAFLFQLVGLASVRGDASIKS